MNENKASPIYFFCPVKQFRSNEQICLSRLNNLTMYPECYQCDFYTEQQIINFKKERKNKMGNLTLEGLKAKFDKGKVSLNNNDNDKRLPLRQLPIKQPIIQESSQITLEKLAGVKEMNEKISFILSHFTSIEKEVKENTVSIIEINNKLKTIIDFQKENNSLLVNIALKLNGKEINQQTSIPETINQTSIPETINQNQSDMSFYNAFIGFFPNFMKGKKNKEKNPIEYFNKWIANIDFDNIEESAAKSAGLIRQTDKVYIFAPLQQTEAINALTKAFQKTGKPKSVLIKGNQDQNQGNQGIVYDLEYFTKELKLNDVILEQIIKFLENKKEINLDDQNLLTAYINQESGIDLNTNEELKGEFFTFLLYNVIRG